MLPQAPPWAWSLRSKTKRKLVLRPVVGTLVHMNDELRTGPKSRLEVTFRDKTTLTLGENAKGHN
jgi:hypothetical protein